MNYIDTSVFISAYNDRDRNHVIASQFLADLINRNELYTTSVFSLSEIAGFFSRNHSPERARTLIQKLLAVDSLKIMYFEGTREFQDSLLSVCVDTGLSGADAIHFVQALSNHEVDRAVHP